MARTLSRMLALGTQAPDFSLFNPATRETTCLSEIRGSQGTVVMFLCNHCPYVVHIADGIGQLALDYQARGIGFVAINANDTDNYPDDHPDKMPAFAKKHGLSFPYLFDETQGIARAYDAACTPDFYLFDQQGKLVYRGQMDGARPGLDQAVTAENLRLAIDHLLENRPPLADQKPSLGCGIKWRS